MWVADLLAAANDKLRDRHLSLGPSYFMQEGIPLNEERVRFLWEQAVLPYIEEQYLDDVSQLEAFAFDRLLAALD